MITSLSAFLTLALLSPAVGTVDPVVLNVVKHLEDPALIATLKCESEFQQYKPDGSLLMGTHGEIGIAQFQPETWSWMNEIRGTHLDIRNALAQLNMIEWAFAHHLQSHWTCYHNPT